MLASISLPDNATLSKVSNLEVLDASGSRVRFGSFYEESKVIVVFIRHFFCGVRNLKLKLMEELPGKQLYVSQLTSEFEKLPKAFEEGNVDTIVVGCGDWQPIERYSEITGFPSSKIFADPSLGVFHGLGMNVQTLARTPAGEKKASYLTEGALKGSLWSIWRALKTPLLIGKQGNIAQLGGEFVFEPGNRCTFAHRMQHTEDHAEISELLAKAGCHSSTNNSL